MLSHLCAFIKFRKMWNCNLHTMYRCTEEEKEREGAMPCTNYGRTYEWYSRYLLLLLLLCMAIIKVCCCFLLLFLCDCAPLGMYVESGVCFVDSDESAASSFYCSTLFDVSLSMWWTLVVGICFTGTGTGAVAGTVPLSGSGARAFFTCCSHRWRWPRLWTNSEMLSTFRNLFVQYTYERTHTMSICLCVCVCVCY